jgi:hypothetical protein
MEQWTRAAGLDLVRSDMLSRESGSDQPSLTVSLWVAERPAQPIQVAKHRAGAAARQIEEAR